MKFLTVKSLLAAAAIALSANASVATTTATCPNTDTATRYITLSTTSSSPSVNGCYAYGDGNINGTTGQDPILAGATVTVGPHNSNTFNLVTGPVLTDLVLLDNSNPASLVGALDGVLSGALSNVSSGTITVGDVTGYTNLVLGLKFGSNLTPVWGAFLISGAGNYSFSVDPSQNISHVILYGTVAAVPVPATGFLLLGALGAFGLIRKRRKVA